MCGMLQMCLPMELRFLGSYVEDLAKKDFHQLRESEGKANNRHELSKFSETDSRVFRTKMAVYLALLHSSNRTCSNIIFQLLEKHVQEALTVIDNMDVMTVHNILLVLSMAMNHPAFSYHQKSRMYEYYRAANDASERILNKVYIFINYSFNKQLPLSPILGRLWSCFISLLFLKVCSHTPFLNISPKLVKLTQFQCFRFIILY